MEEQRSWILPPCLVQGIVSVASTPPFTFASKLLRQQKNPVAAPTLPLIPHCSCICHRSARMRVRTYCALQLCCRGKQSHSSHSPQIDPKHSFHNWTNCWLALISVACCCQSSTVWFFFWLQVLVVLQPPLQRLKLCNSLIQCEFRPPLDHLCPELLAPQIPEELAQDFFIVI